MNVEGPASELMDAIRAVVDLDFFRMPAESSASELPLLVWRYAKEKGAEQLIAEINSIIESAIQRWRVEWQFRYSGRNWVLAPKRFLELEDSGRFRLYPEILRHLETVDPDLTRRANADLAEIVGKVTAALRDLNRSRTLLH